MSKNTTTHFVNPQKLDETWLVHIYEKTFHKQEEVVKNTLQLYPEGLDSEEPDYSAKVKHILCQTFAFVPYVTRANLQELLEKGKDYDISLDDFTFLRRQAVSEKTAILKEVNFNTSLLMSSSGDVEPTPAVGDDQAKIEPQPESVENKTPYFMDDKRVVDVKTSGVQPKISATQLYQLAPEWKKDHANPARNDALLRVFIRQLRRAKDNGWYQQAENAENNDEILITQAINKSSRQDLYQSMPAEAYSDVEQFIEFIKQAEGRTREEIRDELRNISQLGDEPYGTLLGRIINLFTDLRGWSETPELKTLEEDQGKKFEQDEIISHFLEAISDDRVKSALKQRRNELKITTLAQMAKRIKGSLPKLTPVNKVQLTPLSSKLDALEKQISKLSVNFTKQAKKDNVQPKGKPKKEDMSKVKCEHCDRFGHKKETCFDLHPELRPKRFFRKKKKTDDNSK